MGSPIFPTDLPRVDTFGYTSDEILRAKDVGPVGYRRVSTMRGAQCNVSWRFLESDYSTFIQWWRSELLYGHRWFHVKLPCPAGYTWHLAKFVESNYKARLEGHTYWTVSAELELYEIALEAKPDPVNVPLLNIKSTDTFKYLSTVASDTFNYASPSFDDSAWASGNGPFSDQNFFPPTGQFPVVGTLTGSDVVWIRKTVVAEALPINFIVMIDNGGSLYVNGIPVTIVSTAFPLNSATYTPPADGTLVIALRVNNVGSFPSLGNPIYAGLIATQ